MKKLLLLAAALLIGGGSISAQEIIAYTQDFVDAATIKTATESETWYKTHKKGGVYDFSGSKFIGGAANDAVDAAFKGNKIVTVAAWVYGVPGTDGCIFSTGDQNTGWKFMMSGKTFKATTKGKWDYGTSTATTQIAANQWNLIAFAVPGATSTNTNVRYYASANDGQLWTKNEVTSGRKMANPANNCCAIGNGNQGSARETYNGTIGDLVVITSDALLTNSQIANLIGAAPSTEPYVPVGPTAEEIQALQEKINAALPFSGKVGYPIASTSLSEAVTESNYDELLSDYNAYINSTTITMPVEGKAYNLIFRIPNGDKYYMYRNSDGSLHGSKTEPVGNAAKFVASNVSGNTLQFVVENEYVQWLCTESNKCYGSNTKGLSATVNTASTLTIERASNSLVSGGSIEGITNEQLFGNIRIKGAGKSGTYYFIFRTDDAFISSANNDIYYDDNWDNGASGLWRSSFFEIEETELITKNAWTDLEETLAVADEYSVGESYGQYTLAEGDWNATIEAAQAELAEHTTEANAEELNTTIAGYIENLTLNVPARGTLLTIQDSSDKYVDGTTTSGTYRRGETFSVMYYDEAGHLIGYPGGYTLNNGAAAALTASTATYEFVKGTAKGKLAIKNGNDKYLMAWTDGRFEVFETIESTCNFTVKGEGITSLPVLFKAFGHGFATLYSPVALTLREDVEAYVAAFDEVKGNLKTEEVSTTIPAATPVVLHYTGELTDDMTIAFAVADLTPAAEQDNDLAGTYATIAADENSCVFALQNGNAGFYKYTTTEGATLAGFKAYYEAPAVESETRGFALDFGDVVTAISQLSALNSNLSAIYDLAGRRVNAAQKGILIQNGNKVIR